MEIDKYTYEEENAEDIYALLKTTDFFDFTLDINSLFVPKFTAQHSTAQHSTSFTL